MSWLSDDYPWGGAGQWESSMFGGLGIRGDQVPAAGEHQASILYPDLSLPAEAAAEFCVEYTSIPAGLIAAGAIFEEDGVIEIPDTTPAGIYPGTRRAFKDGVQYGSAPFTVIVGSAASGTFQADDGGFSGGAVSNAPSAASGTFQADDGSFTGGVTSAPPSTASGTFQADDGSFSGQVDSVQPSESTGTFQADDGSFSGDVYGGGPQLLPRIAMDNPPPGARLVRAGRTTPTMLDPLDVDEVDDIYFDFRPELLGTEPIVSALVTCEARVGVDPAAASMRVGAPLFGADQVVQRIRPNLADVIYLVRATATLATGRKVLATCFLPVSRKA